jgi:hypothetical protein
MRVRNRDLFSPGSGIEINIPDLQHWCRCKCNYILMQNNGFMITLFIHLPVRNKFFNSFKQTNERTNRPELLLGFTAIQLRRGCGPVYFAPDSDSASRNGQDPDHNTDKKFYNR